MTKGATAECVITCTIAPLNIPPNVRNHQQDFRYKPPNGGNTCFGCMLIIPRGVFRTKEKPPEIDGFSQNSGDKF